MSETRYYHGAKYSLTGACFAHKDKYTFWVYPDAMKPVNRWDTNIKASDYCNNHIDEGPNSVHLRQYICLGHSKADDMNIVKAEWLTRGIKNDVEMVTTEMVSSAVSTTTITKKFYHGCNIPREFPNGDNCFYVYPAAKGRGKWHTHLSPQEYCSNHTEVSVDKSKPGIPYGEPGFRQFVCNGHDSENGLWAGAGERYANRPYPDILGVNSYEFPGVVNTRFVTLQERICELEKTLENTRSEKETMESENTELRLLMEKAIHRLDSFEKKNTTENEKDQKELVLESKTEVKNNLVYLSLLPIIFALYITLFTSKQNIPVLTSSHYPQITDNID